LRRTINQEVVTSISAGYKSINFRGGSRSDFAGPILAANATWQLGDAAQLSLSLGHQAYQSFFVNNNYYLDSGANIRLLYQFGYNTYLDVSLGHLSNAYADPLDISVTPDTPPDLDRDGNGRIDNYEPLPPSVGRRRRDGVDRLTVGVGFQPLRTLRLFIGYNGERRASNIEQLTSGGVFDPFDYSVNRIVFRIEAGWL
jgi:hypothetical protein